MSFSLETIADAEAERVVIVAKEFVLPRMEVIHRPVVEGQLYRSVEIVLDTNLSSNTEAEGEVSELSGDICSGANIPVETFHDVPTPLIGSGELETGIVIASIMPIVETKVHFKAVQFRTNTPHERNFNRKTCVTITYTGTDSVLLAAGLCHC